MIKKITIKDVASYHGDPVEIDGLTQFCFFYGANGSGKTTISRVVRNPNDYPTCNVEWENGVPLQTLVYNKDFTKETFYQAEGIPGVFTLGDAHTETVKQIEKLEIEKENSINLHANLLIQLNGSEGKPGK
jgi:wobble nucleotide-excising tRNase